MREGIYVHLVLIHVVVWQKPTHFKATILQLKINLKNILKKLMDHFDWVMTIANTFLAFPEEKKRKTQTLLSAIYSSKYLGILKASFIFFSKVKKN